MSANVFIYFFPQWRDFVDSWHTVADFCARACVCVPGLPDGIFAYQKSQFGYILEGFGTDNVGIFMVMWYIYAIWKILRPFGKFCGHLVWCFLFLVSCTKKNLAALLRASWIFGAHSNRPKKITQQIPRKWTSLILLVTLISSTNSKFDYHFLGPKGEK
jgi:hypothetical protein